MCTQKYRQSHIQKNRKTNMHTLTRWYTLPRGKQCPEASLTMQVLTGARCTDARLYTLRIKIHTGYRKNNAHERSHC